MHIRASAVLIVLLIAASATAQSPLLIPTLYDGPGAFGSTWMTLAYLNNHTDKPFSSPGVDFAVLGSPEFSVQSTVPPGGLGSIYRPRPANGLLLYLPEEDADIAFTVRFAASPRDVRQGVELPVVREREFKRAPIRLPFVPLLAATNPPGKTLRTTLRIYAPDAQPGTYVRVELRSFISPAGQVLGSHEYELTAPPQETSPPIYPAFAQVHLQDAFADVFLDYNLNVTVVPLPLESGEIPRIWAFVTTTNNVTQETTLQRPQ